MPSYLVTGGRGQLGSDLGALLGGHAAVLGRDELDIADSEAIERSLAEHRPEVVVNCAAYHVVDACETDPAPPLQMNVVAVAELARACTRNGARLVHLSTNYVFPGDRDEPYGEEDLPDPRSIYAISKLAGEYAALSYAPRAIVVRSAGLYGEQGNASKGGNFVQRILARAEAGEPLRVVADQRLSPTYTPDLAVAIIEAVEAGVEGVLHLTSAGACSWHEFTEAILAEAGVEAEVTPAPTEPKPGLADRPRNGVLARPRADAAGLTPLRPWREALSAYLAGS
ncbi:MAG: dTDP-4-dehydrorhamnose reductase [Thermoleophilaceae bacterium]|nr:dTDP-4-dehydrorhamnose reductase [Thermoleophilaceae bacterium]